MMGVKDEWKKGKEIGNLEQKDSTIFTNIHWQINSALR